MHYIPRDTTDSYHLVVDEIANNVAEHGSHETLTVALANTCFRKTDSRSSQEQLDEWCQNHGFGYNVYDERDTHKRIQQFIRFFRR